MLSTLQVREAVHVTLLRRLVARVPEGLRLKGGVNLRLFYGSVRYSEDMDLDADPRHRNKMRPILESIIADPTYRRELDAIGIEDVIPNTSQPTAGDAGVKVKMQVMLGGVAYPTKVEVSFRGSSPAAWAAPHLVSRPIVERYGGGEFSVSQYSHAAAVVQKVNALATRSDVQARDIFDLDWLLNQERFPDTLEPAKHQLRDWHKQQTLATATERCLAIGDDQYRDQVESFLDAEVRAQFAGKWDEMRLRVHTILAQVTKMSQPARP